MERVRRRRGVALRLTGDCGSDSSLQGARVGVGATPPRGVKVSVSFYFPGKETGVTWKTGPTCSEECESKSFCSGLLPLSGK